MSAPVRPVPVNDVFSPEALARPHAFAARMRAQEPVLHGTGRGRYVVLSHAECAAVLGDPAWGRGYTQGLNDTRPGVDLADMPGSFLLLDPPEHTRLRRLVSHAFTPRSVEAQRGAIEDSAERLLDDALRGAGPDGELDLVAAFAYPLGLSSICRMLGVPVADQERFGSWASALVRGLDPEPLLSPAEIAARGEAVVAFARYFADMVAARRAEPRDDLVSHLARVADGDDSLTSREITDVAVALLVAGAETTMDVIASAVLALHRHPEQLAVLRERPDLVRPAVEEFLRFDPPIPFPQRTALADSAIAGHPMPRGTGVHLALGAANRDPEVYADPDRLDVTRFAGPDPAPRHLALSHGVHFCIGAMLARLEIEAAVSALVRRCADVTVLVEEPPMRPTIAFRGIASLPVRLR